MFHVVIVINACMLSPLGFFSPFVLYLPDRGRPGAAKGKYVGEGFPFILQRLYLVLLFIVWA